MKKFVKQIQSKVVIGLLIIIAFSCNKKWEEHYVTPDYLKSGSVFELLASNPDYSQFVGLITKTGYDTILKSGGTYTVLALKNGAFTGIDTVTNLVALKKIIGMHIANSSIYTDGMNNTNILSVSGKLLKFTGAPSVNGIALKGLNSKAVNGVIQEAERVIFPIANLYDVIVATPELSFFKTYIDSSFKYVVDVEKNTRIGFDTLNQPVYQQPIIYKQLSNYLAITGINNENVVRTVFMPNNTAVNNVISNLLVARAGKANLIIPALGTKHKDTTVGYVYFPANMPYAGDTAILLDYLYSHPVIDKEIPALAAGTNTFTNIFGIPFNVSTSQVKTNATPASNGIYYILNNITLPDVVYRSRFMFLPFPKIPNPANPTGPQINNPDIIYSGGTNTSPSQTSNSSCYTGKFTRFNFVNVGGKVEFNFPFVTKGNYRVNLKNYLDANGALVTVSYGSQVLKQNLNTSTLNIISSGMVDVDLGIINVPADGSLKLTFTCTGVSPKTAAKYEFCVDLVELIPVQ
ncbi:MAG TPA: fasciclin domain-containing protein [Chitinophagaceae bacterium]|nr:fasciclin domain-containing protein [Chitinophagaceae bacterium]